MVRDVKIVRYYTDDWVRLEIDGDVYQEGHTLDIDELMEDLSDFFDIDYEARSLDDLDDVD